LTTAPNANVAATLSRVTPLLKLPLTQKKRKNLEVFASKPNATIWEIPVALWATKSPSAVLALPLSYNPKKQKFYFDADCPLMDVYVDSLADSNSEASAHLAKVSKTVAKLEVSDPVFLQQNYEMDKAYFDLKKSHPRKK
jgi:hypothetical protein